MADEDPPSAATTTPPAAAPADSGLRLADLRVAFGDRVLFSGLDLEVAAGEVVALLGPSGCGKTTLLRCITGLQPLDAGEVRLDGVVLDALPPEQRRVGLMFQRPLLLPHLDVGRNVAFGLPRTVRRQGRSARAAAVATALDEVGLAGFERRRPESVSGGEAQRICLARTLVAEPAALLLDEPLSALDRDLRERLADDIRRLAIERQLPTIHVTHDETEADRIADRVLRFSDLAGIESAG